MKKSLALILGLCIFLSACTAGNPTETIGDPTTTPPTSSQTTATTASAETGGADETTVPSVPDSTQPSDTFVSAEATHPTTAVPDNKEDTDIHKQKEPKETETPVNITQPTNPPETQPPTTATLETNPPVTEPPETQLPVTDPPATEPPTTYPPKTEPTECQHDWLCIHHQEEGYWIAGIVCDCGWKVYGDPEELISLWNTHSASYPAAESLFDHGGYGCVDEWTVDIPAYDEWVCRYCAEPKL